MTAASWRGPQAPAPPDLGRRWRFLGRMIPYSRRGSAATWGSFYVDNLARAQRPAPLHAGPCPLCALVTGERHGPSLARFHFADQPYGLIRNENPLVDPQLLVFPIPGASRTGFLEHRRDLVAADVELIAALASRGFSGLAWEDGAAADGEAQLRADAARSPTWASYVNTFPGTGRSVTHLHLNAVPAGAVPLPRVEPAPWRVCRDAQRGSELSRLAIGEVPALAVEAATPADAAASIERLHVAMNEWQRPYNLVAWPRSGPAAGIRLAVIPRDREHCPAVDQRIAGLEFLTGVLLPGPERLAVMDSIRRDQGFAEATLDEPGRLHLERRLRGLFGMPSSGAAVYSVPAPTQRPDAERFRAVLRPNQVARLSASPNPWSTGDAGSSGDASAAPNPRTPDADEPSVLVRITRASLCQSDRRVLLGTKASDLGREPLVLGHEAGGYVVDPGPWEHELRAGEMVVVLPHLTCGVCEPCRSYQQNRCQRIRHLGFHLHGGLADLMCFPIQTILPVGPGFPEDALPLVEPLACVLRAIFRIKDQLTTAALPPGSRTRRLVVFGGGPMGCLFARAVSRFWPAVQVTLVEPEAERREVLGALRMADTVLSRLAPGVAADVAVAASSSLQASRDAVAAAADGGGVVLFSGINTDDLGAATFPAAPLFEEVHRGEQEIEHRNEAGQRCRLLGSSGYCFDDTARSLHELRHHYDHYRAIQNLSIAGLCEQVTRMLAPRGIDHPEHGPGIARSLKVLIRLPAEAGT